MIKDVVKKVTRKVFPKGSRFDTKLKNVAVHLRLIEAPYDQRYHAWAIQTEPNTFSKLVDNQDIKFSIVTPAFNTPPKYLQPLLYSIINQTYDNWEFVVVNASSDDELSSGVRELANVDARIKVIDVKNKGIADNTNVGLKVAVGDYVVLLDHDDTLAAEALNELAIAINDNKSPNLVYSDEDKLADDGSRRHMPHLKNDLSIDQLRNLNYITHIVCIKNSFLKSIGYLDSAYDGAQDYDLMLRVVDNTDSIVYAPKVLYHWREAEASTAADFNVKPYVLEAGVNALREHLKRNKIKAEANPIPGKPGFYRIKYAYSGGDIAEVKKPNKHLPGSKLVVIADDKINRSNNWQPEFGGVLEQNKGVGIVCPIIINQHLQIVDAGQIDKVKDRLFYGTDFAGNTYCGDSDWVRNIDVAGPAIVTRKDLLEEFFISGKKFDAKVYSKFVKSKGLRIVLWPFDPWMLAGEVIEEKQKALMNDMSAYRGYGEFKK